MASQTRRRSPRGMATTRTPEERSTRDELKTTSTLGAYHLNLLEKGGEGGGKEDFWNKWSSSDFGWKAGPNRLARSVAGQILWLSLYLGNNSLHGSHFNL